MSNEGSNNSETIAAIATPSGRSALSIIRLSGPKTVDILSPIITLQNSKSLSDLPAQKIVFGRIHKNGELLDQIMLSLFYAPHSYTGENCAEITCHGSPAVIKAVLQTLLANGARLAQPGEFTQRAFLNGKLDLTQAEAVAQLIRANTEISRRVALEQLEGTFSQKLNTLRAQLIELLAHIEVGIDHSDDPTSGVAMPHDIVEEKIEKCLIEIEFLIKSYDTGRLIQEGVKIAIVGKPNVGKSSLLNRLVRSDRAIVTEIPGTTRDTLEEGFDLFGLPAILVDTAGLREKVSDRVEELGVDRTLKAIEKADIILVLLDQSSPLTREDENLAQLTQKKEKVLVALNKNDRPKRISSSNVETLFGRRPTLSISVIEDRGMDEILHKLYSLTLPNIKEGEFTHEGLVTTMRHKDCLTACKKSLDEALNVSKRNLGEECLALEIHSACDALGEIVGNVFTDDILSAIFSKFCIGK